MDIHYIFGYGKEMKTHQKNASYNYLEKISILSCPDRLM